VTETLVYVEDDGGEPTADSLGVLSKAVDLGGEVGAVLCGSAVAGSAARLREFGAARVYVAEHPALSDQVPQPRVDVLARLHGERGFESLLFATSTLTADIAAGLAARLETGLNWDLVELERRDGALVGTRLALDDSVSVEVAWKRKPQLALIRPGTFEPQRRADEATVENVEVSFEDWSTQAVVVEHRDVQGEEQSIEDAVVIVAGGRGIGRPENLALLDELAAVLDGAVAATMPLVDMGWCPQSMQVGQTGKRVRPKLYIACGVAGAIQHKVGMDRSGTIVAINTDPNAPIFRFCDLGVIGDVCDVVPGLTELIRRQRA
jgi:electron transfer flavoprotein alpha subunit